MTDKKSLSFLSIIAIIVVFMTGVTWYHNELYQNNPATVSAESPNQKQSMDINQEKKPTAENKAYNSNSVEVSTVIAGLDLPKEKKDQSVELTQNLLKDMQQASQNLNTLLIPNMDGKSDVSDKISVIQRDFKNKYDQYQLDLSDLIGDKSSEKVTGAIQVVIPPILIQNSGPAPTMDMQM